MKWRDLATNYKGAAERLRVKSPSEILRVPENGSIDDIKKAYRRLAKIYHPDKSDPFVQSSNEEVLKIINSAYESLARKG